MVRCGRKSGRHERTATFRKFLFTYLYDGDTGATALAFGATVARSIYVFDKERKLRYAGRIDDNPADAPATNHEAADAVEALLAGNPVAIPKTTATGCPLRLGTDKSVIVLAGIGDNGTEAAGELVSSESGLSAVSKWLHQNPTTANLEMVLSTDVIAGRSGPPAIVAATIW